MATFPVHQYFHAFKPPDHFIITFAFRHCASLGLKRDCSSPKAPGSLGKVSLGGCFHTILTHVKCCRQKCKCSHSLVWEAIPRMNDLEKICRRYHTRHMAAFTTYSPDSPFSICFRQSERGLTRQNYYAAVLWYSILFFSGRMLICI